MRVVAKAKAMLRPPELAGDDRERPSYLAQPFALPWHSSPAVRLLNRFSVIREVRKAIRSVAPGRAPVFVTGSPAPVAAVGNLGEAASIYYCLDDYGASPGVSGAMIQPLEDELLSKVDAVVATARILAETRRPASGRVYYLPQGVNYEPFAVDAPAPADVRDLPHPRIGVAGSIDERCDVDLIRAVAEANPAGSVIIVGPLFVPRDRLDLPNIHLLGKRPYSELPAYMQSFDVGLVPYVLNRAALAINPLKLLEYLAAGIPVVTTALPEARSFASMVAIAEDQQAFIEAVRVQRERDDERQRLLRRRTAREHTWDVRAERFLEIAAEVVGQVAAAR